MGFMIANSPARTPWNTGYVGKENTISKTFACIYCEAENAVEVKLYKKQNLGTCWCKKCHQEFRCEIIHLDSEVDVYAKWIDACEEAARNEIARENAGRIEKKAIPTVEATKPPVKRTTTTIAPAKPTTTKRKLEDDAPQPDTKRSKPKDMLTETKATNLTNKPSTLKAPAEVPLEDLVKSNGHWKEEWELAVERNRAGRAGLVRAEAKDKAALAKERRERKAKEWARQELEEARRWRAVTKAAIAAAHVMMKKRLEAALLEALEEEKPAQSTGEMIVVADKEDRAIDSGSRRHSRHSLLDSPSDEDTLMEEPEEGTVAATEPIATEDVVMEEPEQEDITAPDPIAPEDVDDLYDALFGSSSSNDSANSIYNVPTPRGSPQTSLSRTKQAEIPSIHIEFVETTEEVSKVKQESQFASSLPDEEGREIDQNRRNSIDSLFGDSE